MYEPKGKDLGDPLEMSVEKIELLLKNEYGLSRRSIALLLLQEDKEVIPLISSSEPDAWSKIKEIIEQTKSHYSQPLAYIIAIRRQEEANRIAKIAIEHLPNVKLPFME